LIDLDLDIDGTKETSTSRLDEYQKASFAHQKSDCKTTFKYKREYIEF